MAKRKKTFVRHFRIYFRNNHPAYIVDEEGNKYVFHRVTHSKTTGGRNNWKKENPLTTGGDRPMYIVRKEEKDNKGRFSLFSLEVKPNTDISYPDIKKAGGSQTIVVNNISTSKDIKSKRDQKGNKKLVPHSYISKMNAQILQPAHLLKQTRAKSTRRKNKKWWKAC